MQAGGWAHGGLLSACVFVCVRPITLSKSSGTERREKTREGENTERKRKKDPKLNKEEGGKEKKGGESRKGLASWLAIYSVHTMIPHA